MDWKPQEELKRRPPSGESILTGLIGGVGGGGGVENYAAEPQKGGLVIEPQGKRENLDVSLAADALGRISRLYKIV